MVSIFATISAGLKAETAGCVNKTLEMRNTMGRNNMTTMMRGGDLGEGTPSVNVGSLKKTEGHHGRFIQEGGAGHTF